MVDEKDVSKIPEEETTVGKQNTEFVENYGTAAPVFLIIVLLIITSCPLLYLYKSYRTQPDNNITSVVTDTATSQLSVTNTTEVKPDENLPVPRKRIKIQPNCTAAEYIKETLKEIWFELRLEKVMCTPEDFHDIKKHSVPNLASNNNKVAEPRGHFVIYIAVGLLLTSLVAAFLDVYKVRGNQRKSKPQLTKRCSLADLTVLRHSRRESMRRDSMMDEHRTPLKLLGARPPPDSRRCSFPAYPGDFSTYGHNSHNISPRQGGSRKSSLGYYEEITTYDFHPNRVVRLIRRF